MDLIRLTRPIDFPLFFAAVVLGGWLAAGSLDRLEPALEPLAAAGLAAALIGLGANVVNDLYDVDIDRRNAPQRPLPAGRVSRRAAGTLWAGLSAAGVAAALLASPRHALVAAAGVAVLWAYSARLKRVALVGHLLVGAVLASAVAYGAFAVDPGLSSEALAGAALAFVLVSAREVAKAIPDIEGDHAAGASTLPTVIGPRGSAAVVALASGTAVAGVPLLTAIGFEPMVLAYALPMAALLLSAAWVLLTTEALPRAGTLRWSASARRASRLMKLAMGAGVVALALGR